MKSKITYHEQTDMENTLKLREVLKTLPSFTSEFFRGISTTTSTSTRIKYAYDLRIFFLVSAERKSGTCQNSHGSDVR